MMKNIISSLLQPHSERIARSILRPMEIMRNNDVKLIITQQFEATRSHIEKHIPNLDFAVIEAIFTQPYIKAIHLVSDKIKSRNTAKRYLDQLCNIQVIELKHIGNEIVYINNDLVRILEST